MFKKISRAIATVSSDGESRQANFMVTHSHLTSFEDKNMDCYGQGNPAATIQ
jgi:hypothetical protein